MTIPPLDLQYPLCAESLPGERLPAPGADATPLLLALVRQAFSLIRSSQAWKKGKTFGQKDDPGQGGSVQSLYCPSDMDGRLKKCAWHARHSRHNPADSGLSFEDLHDGLGTDQHTLNEAEYIHDIIETIRIAEVIPGRAEVWRNSYNLPSLTANRDFTELVVTLPLPPSPEPFSKGHEEVVAQQLSTNSSALLSRAPEGNAAASPQARRSFVVISLPVAHPQAPERPNEFVRGKYCSVEAVWETLPSSSPSPSRNLEWFMAVQSDSGGKIPLFFQEMAMPSKISEDVPLFFKWAKERKAKGLASTAASDKDAQSGSTKQAS